MDTIKESATTEWVQINNKECLKITCYKMFTNQEAMNISENWKNMFAPKADKRFSVIFNCENMADYEPMARTIMQKTISELKKQIDTIWVVILK